MDGWREGGRQRRPGSDGKKEENRGIVSRDVSRSLAAPFSELTSSLLSFLLIPLHSPTHKSSESPPPLEGGREQGARRGVLRAWSEDSAGLRRRSRDGGDVAEGREVLSEVGGGENEGGVRATMRKQVAELARTNHGRPKFKPPGLPVLSRLERKGSGTTTAGVPGYAYRVSGPEQMPCRPTNCFLSVADVTAGQATEFRSILHPSSSGVMPSQRLHTGLMRGQRMHLSSCI